MRGLKSGDGGESGVLACHVSKWCYRLVKPTWDTSSQFEEACIICHLNGQKR
jgi:hypothetical protein